MKENIEQQVKGYVMANTVSAKEGRRCIDGRYPKDPYSGLLARPGSDFGYVMVLLALRPDWSPQHCLELVYSIAAKRGGFHMHTGCGHIANALNQETALRYGLNSQRVKQAYEQALKKSDKPLPVLDGKHQEQAMLRITGTKKTVIPNSNGSMYFVYDETRDREFMKKILLPGLPGCRFLPFLDLSNRQLSVTVQLLAQGLPVFTVNVDDPAKPRVIKVK